MNRRRVLIETSWNVKVCAICTSLCALYCINRNIVECKVHEDVHSDPHELRINRNIVECKVMSAKSFTLKKSVLIETSWNVKSLSALLFHKSFRINRNIVECKDISLMEWLWTVWCINRNIVECKVCRRIVV